MGAFSNYGNVSGFSSTPKLQVDEVDFGYADNPSEIVDLDPWFTTRATPAPAATTGTPAAAATTPSGA